MEGEGIHLGFETQDRGHQMSIPGVKWAPKKRTIVLENIFKLSSLCFKQFNL